MPYYSFDLVLGEEYKNQGGLILEDVKLAADRADQLAIELAIVHPELKAKGCSVRVTNADDTGGVSQAARSHPVMGEATRLSVSRWCAILKLPGSP